MHEGKSARGRECTRASKSLNRTSGGIPFLPMRFYIPSWRIGSERGSDVSALRKETQTPALEAASSDASAIRRGVGEVPDAALSDAALLAQIADGRSENFPVLLERYLARMLATARRMLGDDGEAEDAAQEAMLRLWRNAGRIDVPAAGVGPWLYRVTANICLDRLRARRPTSSEDLEAISIEAEQERELGASERTRALDQALQSLPERQRLALILFHFEGHSVREIAAQLETTEDAAESLLGRARRALKKNLESVWRELL